jgi:hypothetical protein
MKQQKEFVVKEKKEMVCKMKNSLYGLKQSPWMWYQTFDTYMLGLGFTRSKEDHYVYFKLIGDCWLTSSWDYLGFDLKQVSNKILKTIVPPRKP